MKKIITSMIIFFSVMLTSLSAGASEVTVLINDRLLVSDQPAQIVNDRTMLPMRAIFETLGATVTWMQNDKMIFATKDDALIVMQIDNNKMSVQKTGTGENNVVELDSVPFVHNDRTFVPVRAIAEALGATVEWVAETYTVKITLK